MRHSEFRSNKLITKLFTLLLVLYLFLSPLTVRAIFQDDTGAKRLAWISALEQCESRGRENLRILDSNNKYSYGVLQFQKSTFNAYGIKYELSHDNIYLKEQQEFIALSMLNDGLWKHWYNCGKATTKKLGYSYPADI